MLRALQKSFKEATSSRRSEDVIQQPQEPITDHRGKEASMEEIVASIRRIVPDDQILPLMRSLSASSHALQSERRQETDVHQGYDEGHTFHRGSVKGPQAPAQDHVRRNPRKNAHQRLSGPTFRPDPEPIQRAAPALPARFSEPETARIEQIEQESGSHISSGSVASVSASFNALATAVLLQNEGLVEESVREVIRPIIKTWLDANLSGIVEQLVRQEIDRISRGRY